MFHVVRASSFNAITPLFPPTAILLFGENMCHRTIEQHRDTAQQEGNGYAGRQMGTGRCGVRTLLFAASVPGEAMVLLTKPYERVAGAQHTQRAKSVSHAYSWCYGAAPPRPGSRSIACLEAQLYISCVRGVSKAANGLPFSVPCCSFSDDVVCPPLVECRCTFSTPLVHMYVDRGSAVASNCQGQFPCYETHPPYISTPRVLCVCRGREYTALCLAIPRAQQVDSKACRRCVAPSSSSRSACAHCMGSCTWRGWWGSTEQVSKKT